MSILNLSNRLHLWRRKRRQMRRQRDTIKRAETNLPLSDEDKLRRQLFDPAVSIDEILEDVDFSRIVAGGITADTIRTGGEEELKP